MLSIRNSKWSKGIAVTLALAGMMAFAGCGQKQQAKSNVIPVKSMQVKRQDTPDTHEFTGFVEAQQEAKITANVSGRITSKNFNGGDYVQAGQVLFTIDQRTYQANVLKAQADLANAKSELIRLNRDADRYTQLYNQHAVSKQTYDNAIAQRDQAQASVDAYQARLENARISMHDTEVVAPFSGRIDTSDLAVGNYVTAGQTVLATMSNLDPVRIKFSISENEYLQLAKAYSENGVKSLEDLKLILSDGTVYSGRGVVDQANREITSGTGTLTLKARYDNPNHMLMPGMFARVQANAGTLQNAILIPQRAVKEMLYKKFVFVIGSDNKVDMKEVKLGARVGRFYIVESGLEGNENLVVEGVQKVSKGSEVKATPMTEADLDTTVDTTGDSASSGSSSSSK